MKEEIEMMHVEIEMVQERSILKWYKREVIQEEQIE